MFYKNVSHSVKTFYGVTFKPGDIKSVDSYINDRFMIPCSGEETNVTPEKVQLKQDQQKLSSDKSKKEDEKKSEPKKENKVEDSEKPEA